MNKPLLKCGDVVTRFNHVTDNGTVKDRWFVVAGVWSRENRHYYLLLYCTSKPQMFPNASIGCSKNSSGFADCYVAGKYEGQFKLTTYISFISAEYNRDFSLVEHFDRELSENNIKIQFRIPDLEMIKILTCAKDSIYMSNRALKQIRFELEELELPY